MTNGAEKLKACANTDRELWRETEGDYYAPSIHVTEHGGIGIDIGGTVVVRPIREWHALATRTPAPSSDIEELVEAFRKAEAAREKFEHGREAMNAARPDPVHATPAERALYDERYQADNENERAYRIAALELFTAGRITEAADTLLAIQGERATLTRQLRDLAVILHGKHYPEVTQWEPLDDPLGILSQIDNMTTGMVRAALTATG
jgi:hypothetical protein